MSVSMVAGFALVIVNVLSSTQCKLLNLWENWILSFTTWMSRSECGITFSAKRIYIALTHCTRSDLTQQIAQLQEVLCFALLNASLYVFSIYPRWNSDSGWDSSQKKHIKIHYEWYWWNWMIIGFSAWVHYSWLLNSLNFFSTKELNNSVEDYNSSRVGVVCPQI